MANKTEENLEIYYTSDLHGNFEALSRCSAAFAHGGNALVIDGGDTLQGSPLAYYINKVLPDSGKSIPAELMNCCGYDYIVPGNHDLSYGIEVFQKYLDELDAVCLCANSVISGMKQFCIKDLPGGLKIGITGICTPFDKKFFSDAYEAAKCASEMMDKFDPDLKICVYHGGFESPLENFDPLSCIFSEKPMEENQGLRIARDLDFDILLTGHQHHALEGRTAWGTFICQPPAFGRSFLRIIRRPSGEISSQLISPGKKEDEKVSAVLYKVSKKFNHWVESPVGMLSEPLFPESPLKMASEGSRLADFFNQIQQEVSGADVSCTALGNEVSGLPIEVTVKDILTTYVFPNTLKVIKVNGRILRKAIEKSAEYFTVGENGLLEVNVEFLSPMIRHFDYDYFSGIEYVVDPSREKGRRVLSVRYEGEELADEKELTLVLNDYRASGGGGYSFFSSCPVIWEDSREISELVIDSFRQHGTIFVKNKKTITLYQG